MKNKYSPPKTVKKTIRFIHQDATLEQLIEIKKLLDYTINRRKKKLELINLKGAKEGVGK